MIEPGEEGLPAKVGRRGGHLPQLAAVAAVCAVFTAISVGIGFYGLERLDHILLEMVQNRGKTIARNLQLAVGQADGRLRSPGESVFSGLAEDGEKRSGALQQSFLAEFMALAQSVDKEADGPLARDQALEALRDREDLSCVAFLDKSGGLLRCSGDAAPDVLKLAAPVSAGAEEIRIDLFSRFFAGQETGFVAVSRKHGPGGLVLILDESGFRRRCTRFAARRALEELEPDSWLVYIQVLDDRGREMASKGLPPSGSRQPAPVAGAGKTLARAGGAVQTTVEALSFDGSSSGKALMGFRGDTAEELLAEGRRNTGLSALFMALLAGLAVLFIHRNQRAHTRELREMERRIHQAERLSALGRLAGGVAHEIRNPLNAIGIAVQRLKMSSPGKLVNTVLGEVRCLDEILDGFLSIARNRLKFQPHDVADLLDQTVSLMGEEAVSVGVDLRADWGEEPLPAVLDAGKMRQAVVNLLKNAIEATGPGGTVQVTARRDGPAWIEIAVADTGRGIGPEAISRVFDLDYTTKDKGIGFGLPIAYEVVQGHGGEIVVSSEAGRGTTFRVRIPSDGAPAGRKGCDGP